LVPAASHCNSARPSSGESRDELQNLTTLVGMEADSIELIISEEKTKMMTIKKCEQSPGRRKRIREVETFLLFRSVLTVTGGPVEVRRI